MKNIDYTLIGYKIKEARKKANFTQEQLAEKIGTTNTTIGSIERGDKDKGGSVDLFVKIAIALNISLDTLFDIEAAQNEFSVPDEKKFKTIKDFIEISGADFYFDYNNNSEYISSLCINSIELSFYLQEYCELSKIWSEIKNKEYENRVKEIIEKDFDETMQSKFTFDDNKITYRVPNKFLNIENDERDYGLRIFEKDIQPQEINLSDDAIPF